MNRHGDPGRRYTTGDNRGQKKTAGGLPCVFESLPQRPLDRQAVRQVNRGDRPWVLIEVGAAWGLRKPIIAIIDKIGPNEMPDIVSPNKAIDLNDFDQYINS